jgi:hypothetical protein
MDFGFFSVRKLSSYNVAYIMSVVPLQCQFMPEIMQRGAPEVFLYQ